MVLLVLLAFLVDRIALYSWGLGVIRYYRLLSQSPDRTSTKATSITELTLGDIPLMIHSYPPPPRPSHVGFEKSGVRPDHIRLDATGGIHLWYLPPALAWTTRLYPPYRGEGPRPSYRPVDHYLYGIVIRVAPDTERPEVQLYRGFERKEIPANVRWPEVFP